MTQGGRAAEGLWARSDLRRRWRSLVVLGLIAGATAGLAAAAFAGARRTDTALERLRAATNAPDAIVFSSQVGEYHPDWTPLRARPEVRAVAVWDLLFGNVDGEPGGLLFASHDGRFLGEVGRPVVVEGRMYDDDAPLEVVVSEPAAKTVPVGSTFAFQPFTPDQTGFENDPRGPRVTMKVVGAVRLVNQFLFTPEQVLVSPGFRARYGHEALLLENADVKLAGGPADIAALKRHVDELVAPGTPVLDLHSASRRVDTTLSVERNSLLLLCAVVGLAGGLLVSQALIRSARVIGDDASVLRAVGMARRNLVRAAVLAHLVTAGAAMVVAATTAIVASRFFPIGLGRRIDVDVGTHVDWVALIPGVVGAGATMVAGVAVVAWRVSGPGTPPGAPGLSALITALRRRAPVPVGLGVGMALERGRGRSSVAARPALVGAMVGVLGVVAALTIDRGIEDSLAHPERAGVTWDATVTGDLAAAYEPRLGFSREAVDQVLDAAPPGSAAAVIDRQVLAVDGVGVPTFALRSPRGDHPVTLSITKGRAPRTLGEAVMGPETARILGVGLGDTTSFDRGPRMKVVGIGLFPSDVHAEFDEGIWVTPEQLERVIPSPSDGADFKGDRFLAVRFPDHVDAAAEMKRMAKAPRPPLTDITPVDVPVELENLRNVRTLPVLLAGFLALLGVAAVGHVLVTSAIRRRQEFAVFRALGFTSRGSRLVLSSQGTTIGAVGLLMGVPLGVALGRTGWHWVAEQVPLEDVPPLAMLAVLLILPVTLAIANALAVWPGHRAARVRPAEVLRAE